MIDGSNADVAIEVTACVVAVPNLIVLMPVPSKAWASNAAIVAGKSGAQLPAATL